MGWEDAAWVVSKLKKTVSDAITNINTNTNNKSNSIASDIKSHVTSTVSTTMTNVINNILLPALPDNRDPLTYSSVRLVRPTYSLTPYTNGVYSIEGYSSAAGWVKMGSGPYEFSPDSSAKAWRIRYKSSNFYRYIQTPVTINGKGTVLCNICVGRGSITYPNKYSIYNYPVFRHYIKIDDSVEFNLQAFININTSQTTVNYYNDFWKFDFSKKVILKDADNSDTISLNATAWQSWFDYYEAKNYNQSSESWEGSSSSHDRIRNNIYALQEGLWISDEYGSSTGSNYVRVPDSNPMGSAWASYRQQALSRFKAKYDELGIAGDIEIPQSKTYYYVYLA